MNDIALFGNMWGGRPRKGIRVRPGDDPPGGDLPHPVIRIGDISSDPIGLISTKSPGSGGKLLRTSRKSGDPTVTAGDLVIIVAGSTSRCAVADETNEGCIISQNLVAVSLREEYSPYYVCWYLNSAHGQHQFAQYSKGSSITRSISLHNLEQMEIPLLPQEMQGNVHALFLEFHRHERRLVEEREERTRILDEIVRRAQEGGL